MGTAGHSPAVAAPVPRVQLRGESPVMGQPAPAYQADIAVGSPWVSPTSGPGSTAHHRPRKPTNYIDEEIKPVLLTNAPPYQEPQPP